MHAKLLFPDKRSRFNERRTDANLHAFVAIIGDILSSHDKNQIHVHNHARVHIELWTCLWSLSLSIGNLSMLFLIPTLPKPTAYFSVISSRRLLNQENAHTRHGELLRNAHVSFFNHWIRAWWKHMGWCLSQMWSAKARESLRFCAILSGSRCSLTQSF